MTISEAKEICVAAGCSVEGGEVVRPSNGEDAIRKEIQRYLDKGFQTYTLPKRIIADNFGIKLSSINKIIQKMREGSPEDNPIL